MMESNAMSEETHLQVDAKHELPPTQRHDITPTLSPPLTARQIRLLRYANYKRHPKPPYSYVGIIIHAIHMSPGKCLTLAQIKDKMSEMFEFFRGEYDGWKDSVRHNLSHNACFVRTSQTGSLKSKASLWSVDLCKVPPNAFKRQENHMAKTGYWACDLHVQLGVPEIFLPRQSSRFTFLAEQGSTSQSMDSPCSDSENVWHERRNNSPFLSDSSMEATPKLPQKSRGPIRLRRTNAPRTNIMQESSKQRLMRLVTECAEQSNISQDEAILNLSQLCMSADLSKASPSSPYVSSNQSPYAALYHAMPVFYSPLAHGSQYYNLGLASTPVQGLYSYLTQTQHPENDEPAHVSPVHHQSQVTPRWYSPPDVTSLRQFSPITPPSPRVITSASHADTVQSLTSDTEEVHASTYHLETAQTASDKSDSDQTSAVDHSAAEKHNTAHVTAMADIKQEDNSITDISYACL